jgi:hypothetical protein
MKLQEIDFSPLKSYATTFKVLLWTRRIVRILIRLALFVFVVFILLVIFRGNDLGDGSISFSVGESSTTYLVLILFVPFVVYMIPLQKAWNKFASINSFSVLKHISYPAAPGSPSERMRVPSFRGKLLAVSLFPIIGEIEDYRFGFLTRQYKEGGVLRWRERKMDTVLWIELDTNAPHVVVDARLNERARLSNLSRRYDTSQRIHFEGSTGDKYDVYAAPGNASAALQLFTPDVLAVLFDRLPYVDIEVKGRTIWFVWRYGILDPKLANELFTYSAEFMHEFTKQLHSARFSETQLSAALSE